MITATDKRTPSPGFSTGTPAQAESADSVMVQPTATYMQGKEIVGPDSPAYPLARHLAEELKAHGFATFTEVEPLPKDPPVDPPVDPNKPADPPTEPETERPDDQSRAPDQAQTTASTVPARPGAEPETPPPGPVPPAAKSEPPKAPRRGGRRRKATA